MVDLTEIQGRAEEVAIKKALAATKLTDNSVLIEDVSLSINALNGLPGPYVKDFLNGLGQNNFFKVLSSFNDKSAHILCTFAFCQEGHQQPILFTGRLDGLIVEPRGLSKFGFDTIFEINHMGKTFSEITQDQKNKISHRAQAIHKLGVFLEENADILSSTRMDQGLGN